MSIDRPTTRRRVLGNAAALGAALALGGCDAGSDSPIVKKVSNADEAIDRAVQRALLSDSALAKEYPEQAISKQFRANGSTEIEDPQYRRLAADGFRTWALQIDGLVEHPARYTLSDLRGMPSRTQITRHDCVEGWSCIGKWAGVPLSDVLQRVRLKPEANYLVFHCADTLGESLDAGLYYESIGLADAYHPQTILAYDMNGEPLKEAYGAPLRLRVERQLGYKMAKFVMHIEAVESFGGVYGGKGGYWEDRGYQWYAGI
jgi:DMSO/TMAO reductase YedYZ molybdopterin-dependent catalytic subunit